MLGLAAEAPALVPQETAMADGQESMSFPGWTHILNRVMTMRHKPKEGPYESGRKDGYRLGWLDGWRMGACQGIERHISPVENVKRPMRILYVPQGFEAIDQGVVAALEPCVEHLHVAPSEQMAEIAGQLRPDAVLVMNGLHTFPPDQSAQVARIRDLGIRTAIWFVDDPYVTDETVSLATHYDIVFTQERACVPLYRSAGCPRVHHMPLAAHPGLYRPMEVGPEYRSDVCFIGVAFWNRVKLIDEIASYLKDKKLMIAGALWSQRLSRYGDLAHGIHTGWIEVPETVKYYNGAKIVINMHRTIEAGSDNRNGFNWPAESVNPRTFEIASCGTLQITDLRAELPEHFAVGSEIAVFESASHLIEQIDHYLHHDEERLQMAARSFRRTRRNHTFSNRIGKLLDILGRDRD